MKQMGLQSSRRSVLAVFLLVAFALAACGSQAGPLTEESLWNAEYQGIYQEPIKLTDGKYEGYFSADGGSSRPTIIFGQPYAFRDLDGDGLDDAAVLLVENSGGSGVFVYLAAVLNQRGKPENVATTLLGDRAQVEELTVESGQIKLKMLTHSPGDPMCCPSEEAQATYILGENELVPQGG